MSFDEDIEQWREDAKRKDNVRKMIEAFEKGEDIDPEVERLANIEMGLMEENPTSEEERMLDFIDKKKLEAVEKLKDATTEKNIIICDTREYRSGRPQQLEAAFKAWEIEVKFYPVQLPIGDYIINGACVEFKTPEDFIQSKISGHLDRQTFNMSARYANSYLVVEGDIDAQAEGRVHRNAILSSKIGASFKRSSAGDHGMVNFLEIEIGEFPLFVKFIMAKEHIRYPPPLKVPVKKSEMAVATLSTIPNVSTIRARALLEHFKSLYEIFSATKEELENVEGIGAKTAEGIEEFIHRIIKPKEKHII